MSAPTYEIRTVEDFQQVPRDKIAHCLTDFGLWLSIQHEFRNALDGVEGVLMKTDVFVWIDDGRHDAHFRVVVEGQKP